MKERRNEGIFISLHIDLIPRRKETKNHNSQNRHINIKSEKGSKFIKEEYNIFRSQAFLSESQSQVTFFKR